MLSNISWGQFSATISLLMVIYYVAILKLYFSAELAAFCANVRVVNKLSVRDAKEAEDTGGSATDREGAGK